MKKRNNLFIKICKAKDAVIKSKFYNSFIKIRNYVKK